MENITGPFTVNLISTGQAFCQLYKEATVADSQTIDKSITYFWLMQIKMSKICKKKKKITKHPNTVYPKSLLDLKF